MKELLQQYAAYNVWANNILMERISVLSEKQINKEIASSFPSLYKTTAHLWFAEDIWWQRMKLVENITVAASSFTGSFSELCIHFYKQSQQWAAWVHAANDNELSRVFAYIRNKVPYKMKVQDMLLHLFNHGTFHRGQLVTLLRQLGEDKIPATDFAAWCRLQK
jgi:uncharacterized damage-inducible protein DinB